jgi:hypothetical protein
MSDPFEDSLAEGGPHHLLALLVGDWEGVTRTWFEPGKVAEESPQRGTIRSILGGRFVVHEYESAVGGESLSGMALIGYHVGRGRFEVAWVDTFHMGSGVMFAEGERSVRGFSVRGHYGDPAGGPPWGWRTEFEQPDPDTLVITAYNISPDAVEALAMQTRYHRSTRPANLRL